MIDHHMRLIVQRNQIRESQKKFEREKRDRLLEESKEWPKSTVVNGNERMTLWGAATLISSEIEDDEYDAHMDSFDTRLPKIQDAVNKGHLRAIDPHTLEPREGEAVHSDVVVEDDFNRWMSNAYPFLPVPVNKVRSNNYSVKERKTIIKLIKALRKLNLIKDAFDPRNQDLTKCLEDLLIAKYQDKPSISILLRDMELKGIEKISETAIRNAFNKLTI